MCTISPINSAQHRRLLQVALGICAVVFTLILANRSLHTTFKYNIFDVLLSHPKKDRHVMHSNKVQGRAAALIFGFSSLISSVNLKPIHPDSALEAPPIGLKIIST